MSAAQSTALYVERQGRLHRIAAHAKLVGTLAFVGAVVSTPREQWWAFALDASVVVAVAAIAGLTLSMLARRLTIGFPFVGFALLMPFVGRPPTVEVAGIQLSQAGLWSAWAIIAKGTLCVACTVVLASTTPVPQLIAALERLRVPRTLTAITAFMVRYGDLLTDEMRRMQVARESRGDRARWLWQAKAVGTTAGALFVRSYERGERVFLAMESRGYAGSMPPTLSNTAPSRWLWCLAPAALAWSVAAAAWWVR